MHNFKIRISNIVGVIIQDNVTLAFTPTIGDFFIIDEKHYKVIMRRIDLDNNEISLIVEKVKQI